MDWTTLPSSNNKIDFKIDIEGMKPAYSDRQATQYGTL